MEVFALTLEEDEDKKMGTPYVSVKQYQEYMREFFLLLLGFDEEDTTHDFPEMEEKFRQFWFEEAQMPPEFYTFIDYLKSEGRNALPNQDEDE